MAAVVAEQLRQRGYLHAAVTPHAELRHSPDRATLIFAIDLGSRALIGRAEGHGNSGFRPADLIRRLGVESGKPYQHDAVNARISRYIADRHARGFLAASMTVVPTLANDDRVVNLAIAADQGPRVRVTFDGDPLPAERRADLVPIAREGSADEDLLED